MSSDVSCGDENCPFHGVLHPRGQVFEGIVASAKGKNTVIVVKEYFHYIPKYRRYERRLSRIPAHCPPCLRIKEGDKVRIAECRPLSKTIHFVVIEKSKGE
jgi:small subunit ribosomal protein S17